LIRFYVIIKTMEINEKQKMRIEEVAKRYQLKLVLLFGSFANGKNRKDSDLDIAVLDSKKISFNKQLKIIGEFSRIFGKNIDLTVLNRANPLLLGQINKNCVLLHGRREDFLKFKLRAFRLFCDYAPYFEMEKKLNKKLLNSYAN